MAVKIVWLPSTTCAVVEQKGGVSMYFVIVQTAEGRQYRDTRRVLDFLGDFTGVETLEEGSERAQELWAQAEDHFGRRERERFPRVALLDGESVVWACGNPTRKQLLRALELMRSAPTTSAA